MASDRPDMPDVLIVGAGPTGLSLAMTCRRFGVAVRIIDRSPEPSGVSKALAVWSGSLEALDAMGVIQDFLAEGERMHAFGIGWGTHRLGTIKVGVGIDSPYPYPVLLPQSRTEQLLTQRLATFGVTVERGVELTGFSQDAAGVSATLTHSDGRQETAMCRYLVGCDGARSRVRQTLGMAFDGITEPETFILCDARIEGGSLDPASIYVWWQRGGTISLFPVERDIWRVFAMRQTGSDEPATLDELQGHLDRHGPPGLRLRDPSWLSTFRINERLAATYRVGRCFLAGDAAHIHSPAGGQGMNTGIQDGVNLGWKLAHALHGIGDAETLLDSYTAERRPVAAEVVKGATQKLRLAYGNGLLTRIARTVAVPIMTRIPGVQEALQLELSETGVVYREGKLVALGQPPRRARRTDVGARARDVTYRDAATGQSRSLWPLLGWPGHTLLLFGAAGDRPLPDGVKEAQVQVLRLDAAADPDGSARGRYGIRDDGWVLIRPDQVVAARAAGSDFGMLAHYASQVLHDRHEGQVAA
jgi:2-polyprenyl-6-methoxyphenol hydroxylase-like FAD-dependent oxidoreductase